MEPTAYDIFDIIRITMAMGGFYVAVVLFYVGIKLLKGGKDG